MMSDIITNNNRLSIKVLCEQAPQLSETVIQTAGWLKGIRSGKDNYFVTLNDGSCLEPLQIFFPSSFKQRSVLAELKLGSFLEVRGLVKLTPERLQSLELVGEQIINYRLTSDNYPLQKKNLPLSFVRDHSQFKARTNYFLAMFKLRSETSALINEFFRKEGFFYVNTPVITSNDAEGGGESFAVSAGKGDELFFAKNANLTVSGQLHAEALAQGLGKVYNFSPCFRAENSNTTRHLAEFWMIEAEVTFTDLTGLITIAEQLIKFVIAGLLNNCEAELLHFAKESATPIIADLQRVLRNPFPRVSYTTCVQLLQKQNIENPSFFKFSNIYWGMELNSEHEKYLAEQHEGPIFITDYPSQLKSFYMKENAKQGTVSCMDLVFPRIGEMIGGSAREDNFEILQAKIAKLGVDASGLQWYTELRKNGYAPSAGFGLGLERFLMFLSKCENIKDTTPFPVYAKKLNF